MARIGDVGTLRELDVQPGDVVDNGEGHKWTVAVDWCGRLCDKEDMVILSEDYDGFRLISRATPKPTVWRDMTDAEKGALLLAAHEGRTVEVHCMAWGRMKWRELEDTLTFHDHMAYRVKPESKRETVDVFYFKGDNPTKIGTIDLIDGEPDCNSIKMERI